MDIRRFPDSGCRQTPANQCRIALPTVCRIQFGKRKFNMMQYNQEKR
ncbi:hypothetical protein CAter10_0621 [Collimonas arenae]|nr:hypothetical protein CAter10_0621 [Collimonas arenae]